MRYFNSEIGDDDIWRYISMEMLNMECGKKFYENGTWIERRPGQNPAPYIEIFDDHDIHKSHPVRIRPHAGIIYLPGIESIGDARPYIRKIMDIISAEILAHDEVKNALKSLFTANTDNQGFTALKVKTVSEKCHTNSYIIYENDTSITSLYQRIFYWESRNSSSVTNAIPRARFTWCICAISHIYSFIGHDEFSAENNMSLVSSIVYDKPGYLKLKNRDQLFKSLRLEMFQHFGTFKNIIAYGKLINGHTAGTGTGGAVAKNIGSTLANANEYLIQEHEQRYKYPGHIPGLHINGYSIIYCDVFRCSWEIMRWLSPLWYRLFLSTHSRTGINLVREFRPADTKKLYEINYEEIKDHIINSRDTCTLCACPLYDDIYCLFAYKSSKNCRLFCALCLHACFQQDYSTPESYGVSINSTNVKDNITIGGDYGRPIYIQDVFECEAIGRTVYPRTFAEVVESKISHPDYDLTKYKNIIISMHNNGPQIVRDGAEYIAGIVRDGNNKSWAFALAPYGIFYKIFQKHYYRNVLSDDEYDSVTFIPVMYETCHAVKLPLFGTH
jgi:hypothetical protein